MNEPTEQGATAPPSRDLGVFANLGLGLTTRAGILVGAVGAVVAAFAPAGDIVEGERAFGVGDATQEASIAITVIALIALVLLVLAAAFPWTWAHYAGIGMAAGFSWFYLFFVFAARSDDVFEEGADLTLKSGGVLLIVGSVVTMAGVVFSLAGTRSGPAPDPASFANSAGQTSGKAITALVLGIVSFLVGTVTAALAIAFAVRSGVDLRAAGGRLGGRGLAIGGLVCGIVFLLLWFLGFLALALFANPSSS